MSERDIYKKIIKSLSKKSTSQEFQVRSRLLDVSLEQYCESISQKLSKNNNQEDIWNDIQPLEILFCDPYYYVDPYSNKIREIDIATLSFIDYGGKSINISILGDVKNTDEFVWVFNDLIHQNTIDINHTIYTHYPSFPVYYEDTHLVDFNKKFKIDKELDLSYPFVINHVPYFKSGKEVDSSTKKSKLRDYLNQIYSAFVTFVKENIQSKENDKTIIITILVISGELITYDTFPPKSTSDLQHVNSVLYYGNPNTPDNVYPHLFFPILIINEEYVTEYIEELFAKLYTFIKQKEEKSST